jgi:hypothetical protein
LAQRTGLVEEMTSAEIETLAAVLGVSAKAITVALQPTERRFAKLASLDCMSKDCVPTIERRILICRFDDANERCKVSNQSRRLSVLFPSMRPFTTHSMYNDI